MQSARSRAFSALTYMPGLVSIEPVYLLGIGLAAIAAGSPFGTKAGAGIILPLPLMVVMTGRGLGAGGRADDEAIGAGGQLPSPFQPCGYVGILWQLLDVSLPSFLHEIILSSPCYNHQSQCQKRQAVCPWIFLSRTVGDQVDA